MNRKSFRKFLEKKIAEDQDSADYRNRLSERKSFLLNGVFDEKGIELLFHFCQSIWESLNDINNEENVSGNENKFRFIASGAGYFIGLHKECGGKYNKANIELNIIISQNIFDCIMKKFQIDGIVNDQNQFIKKE